MKEQSMAKQVTISGFVYEADYGYGGEVEYRFFSTDTMGDKFYTLIGPVEFTYDIPDSFNSTAAKVAALEAERDRISAEFAAKVRDINARISNLQALEMTVEAA
jgi:hypothetical protein